MRSFQNIAKLVRNKRVAHPNTYSQSDVSRLLGYKNGQFISNVERGLCNVPLKMLDRICEILSISKEELKAALVHDYEITLNNYLKLNKSEEAPAEKIDNVMQLPRVAHF